MLKSSSELALTPADVTAVPVNPMFERLMKVMHADGDSGNISLLRDLKKAHANAEAVVDATSNDDIVNLQANRVLAGRAFGMYQAKIEELALLYPSAEPKDSRDDISLKPSRLGNVNMVIANSYAMGTRLLTASSRYAMTGILMQERETDAMEKKLKKNSDALKKEHPIYRAPCVLTMDMTVAEYWHYIQKYEDDIAVVVAGTEDKFDRHGEFLGIVGPEEIKKAGDRTDARIAQIFKHKEDVLTAEKGVTPRQAIDKMEENPKSVKNHLIILDNGNLVGITSRKSCGFHLRFEPHVDKKHGGLAYMVALRQATPLDKIEEWMEKGWLGMGIKIDRAHGDRGTAPFRYIREVRKIIDRVHPGFELMAGNYATGEGALRAADAGATAVAVGIGPSPVCLTRMEAGSGVPQITATADVTERLIKNGYGDSVLRVVDGGVTSRAGQAVKAIIAGGTHVMGSTDAAKTRESSPEIKHFEDSDKSKRLIWIGGNASPGVQMDLPKRQNETDNQTYRRIRGPRKEGEAGHEKMNPAFETIRGFAEVMTDGDTSGISFGGGDDAAEAYEYGELIPQTQAGFREGDHRISTKSN